MFLICRLLESERDPVPDVPAVYFVLPTEENVRKISEDLSLGLYDQYYFNFVSPISRQRLEDLATAALNNNSVKQISKVSDSKNMVC